MVKRTRRLEEFERRRIQALRLTPQEAFRIFDVLYQEALHLGAFRRRSFPADFDEAKLRMARILNAERDRR